VEFDFPDLFVNPGIDYFLKCPHAPSDVTKSFGYEWGYAFGDQYPDGVFLFPRDIKSISPSISMFNSSLIIVDFSSYYNLPLTIMGMFRNFYIFFKLHENDLLTLTLR